MNRSRCWKTALFALMLAGGLIEQAGRCYGQKPSLSGDERKRCIESFEIVWQTVRDKHWDPKLGGVDWKAVHDELRPQMDKAASAEECRKVMTAMLARLGQSHFGIIPEAAYGEISKDKKVSDKKVSDKSVPDKSDGGEWDSERGTPGLQVRLVDGKVVVVKAEEEQPAAKAGVKMGWQVVKVDGQALALTLNKIREANKESRHLDYMLNAAVAERLRGNVGEKKEFVFETGDGSEKSLTITLTKPAGERTQFGNLPAFYVTAEGRKLAGNIGYFTFSAFLAPSHVMGKLGETVNANLDANGFILDLRGNPGGIGAMASGVGGWFINKKNQNLGTLYARDGSMNFVLNPRAQTFNGPLAILVDELSASTTEIFAGGLQDLGRAKVFGSRSAGAALPAQIIRLPNGDRFMYAIANYISAGGKPLEGKGVVPDVEVPLRREALLHGQDAVLDAAVEWIRSQKK